MKKIDINDRGEIVELSGEHLLAQYIGIASKLEAENKALREALERITNCSENLIEDSAACVRTLRDDIAKNRILLEDKSGTIRWKLGDKLLNDFKTILEDK
jgi:hypothetical protein